MPNEKTPIFFTIIRNWKLEIRNSLHGFTLLEILLSLAIVAILAAISIPIYQQLQLRNDLDVAVNIWTQTLRRSQELSRAVDGDISWGVNFQSGNIILFKGGSFASRDANFDETFDVNSNINVIGPQEIIFNKFFGFPQITGTTTFAIPAINENREVYINEKGAISY